MRVVVGVRMNLKSVCPRVDYLVTMSCLKTPSSFTNFCVVIRNRRKKTILFYIAHTLICLKSEKD
jgi:hypothetical protein